MSCMVTTARVYIGDDAEKTILIDLLDDNFG